MTWLSSSGRGVSFGGFSGEHAARDRHTTAHLLLTAFAIRCARKDARVKGIASYVVVVADAGVERAEEDRNRSSTRSGRSGGAAPREQLGPKKGRLRGDRRPRAAPLLSGRER